MKRVVVLLCCGGLTLLAVSAFAFSKLPTEAAANDTIPQYRQPVHPIAAFDVQVLVHGRPLEEYVARGKSYVEAIAGAEYEVRIRNPLPYRVAVALSVDGLNTIDARHTTAWNASKWVIEPYGSIDVSGWQMSSERARRFYFTSERDSYGAKLGQTANLGNISAVFFSRTAVLSGADCASTSTTANVRRGWTAQKFASPRVRDYGRAFSRRF